MLALCPDGLCCFVQCFGASLSNAAMRQPLNVQYMYICKPLAYRQSMLLQKYANLRSSLALVTLILHCTNPWWQTSKHSLPAFCCRLIFEDDKHSVQLYNAVNDQLLHLEEVSLGLAAALWDAADPNVLLLSDGHMLYTYLYSPVSLHGAGTHTCMCCYHAV